MSRPIYNPKETKTGTGSLDTYTFDFKIEDLTYLEVVELDDNGVETQRVRGDDVVYLDSVTFDSVEGGGTVVLAANLPLNYSLILLQANDEPTQDFEFRNKTSFTLRKFENAIDAIAGAIQRLAFLAKRSISLHESEDETNFSMRLPPGISTAVGKAIVVNATGDGLDYSDILGGGGGDITAHLADLANPHQVTATQINLGNVNNTSDVNKPISTATQTALNLKADETVTDDHETRIGTLETESLDYESRIGVLESAPPPSTDPVMSTKNANFTAAYDNAYVIVGTINAQLPALVTNKRISFKLNPTAQLTLLRVGGEQIDFVAANAVISDSKSAIELHNNGTDWFIF